MKSYNKVVNLCLTQYFPNLFDHKNTSILITPINKHHTENTWGMFSSIQSLSRVRLFATP